MGKHSQLNHGLAGTAFELGTGWLEDDELPTRREVAVTSGAHGIGQAVGFVATKAGQHVGQRFVADATAKHLAPAILMAGASRAATGQVAPAVAVNVMKAAGEVAKTQSRVVARTQFGAGVAVAPAIEVARLYGAYLFDGGKKPDADEVAEAVGRGVVTGVASTAASWAMTGMVAGSVVPGFGNALGWLAGAVVGYVVSTVLQS
jgi:hypothetical protein